MKNDAVVLKKFNDFLISRTGNESVLIILACASLVGIVTAVALGAEVDAVFAFAATLVIATIALGAIKSTVRKNMGLRKEQFKRRFEMEAPISPEEVRVMQKWVDKTLIEKARDFQDACEAEKQFLASHDTCLGATKHSTLDRLTVIRDVEKLHEIQSTVRITKTGFWSAHNLAFLFGFKVKKTVKDYWDLSIPWC